MIPLLTAPIATVQRYGNSDLRQAEVEEIMVSVLRHSGPRFIQGRNMLLLQDRNLGNSVLTQSGGC